MKDQRQASLLPEKEALERGVFFKSLPNLHAIRSAELF